MITTYLENWYNVSYSISEQSRKQSNDENLIIKFTKKSKKIDSFKAALEFNAESFADFYQGKKLGIFLSGGSESEVIARTYKSIGKDFTAYIVRYENDINLYDVSYAIAIAESQNYNYRLIDFNLSNFFETKAETLSELAQVDYPTALPQLEFVNLIDEIPIIGGAHPEAYRSHDDYTTTGLWSMREWDYEVGWSKYLQITNRPGSMEWWKWTPEMYYGYTKMTWFQKLINDQLIGRLGVNSTKINGYREVYPGMIGRKKKTGFEEIKDQMIEFETYLGKKYNGLPFHGYFEQTYNEFIDNISEV